MRSKASIKSHPIHPMLVGFPIALWVTGLSLTCLAPEIQMPGFGPQDSIR